MTAPRRAAAPPRRRDRSVSTRLGWLCVVVLGLALMGGVSITLGSRVVSWEEISAGLNGDVESLGAAVVAVRVPRTILAALAGAALGLSGAVMQGITRNPLADPGILGVNAGASMAVVIAMAWFGIESLRAYIWVAVAGAGVTGGFVYMVGALGHGPATPLRLALAGAATGIAATSLTVAIVLPRNDISGAVRDWQIGGVGGATYDALLPMLPFLALGLLLCLAAARSLNLLALGDELAAGLGARVARSRAAAALGAVLLCGATTAVCGPIGFVGLVIPHLCRLLVGVDHRWLLPFSALTGAILVMFADVLGRLIARPAELQLGIVTAIVGAPVFVWIVRRRRIREL